MVQLRRLSLRAFDLENLDTEGGLENTYELDGYRGLRFSSVYPGGIYATCEFDIPSQGVFPIATNVWIRVYSAEKIVWEGRISDVETSYQGESSIHRVFCVGAFQVILEDEVTDLRWADQSLQEDSWYVNTGAGADKFDFDQHEERLRMTPKGVSFLNGQTGFFSYTMSIGHNVGRVEFDYDFDEDSQAWEMRLRDPDNAITIWNVTSTSTGSTFANLGTPNRNLSLEMISRAGQTPSENGSVRAEWSNVTIYGQRADTTNGTLGSVNLYEIGLDVRALASTQIISGDIGNLDSSMTYSLKPFTPAGGVETLGSILARAAEFGDANGNPVGFGMLPSDQASDFRPALYIETFPTTADYILTPWSGLTARANLGDVVNWVVVRYDNKRGQRRVVTPDDSSLMTDATSVQLYGTRSKVFDLPGQHSATDAIQYGKRVLARYKDPTYAITSPVTVPGLERVDGGYDRAEFIQAGSVVSLRGMESLLGEELSLIISKADYDDETRSVTLSFSTAPDDLAVYLARLQRSIRG